MKDFSASDTLLTALPVVLVLLALIGAIVFFPEGSALDIRGRAAPVKAVPSLVPLPTALTTPTPQVACSDLYKPVCGKNNQTYANECEAGLAGALPTKDGECPSSNRQTPAL